LNPETQEKLLQLQRYQEQKLRDPVPQTQLVATEKQLSKHEDSSTESKLPKKVSSEHDNSGYFYVSFI